MRFSASAIAAAAFTLNAALVSAPAAAQAPGKQERMPTAEDVKKAQPKLPSDSEILKAMDAHRKSVEASGVNSAGANRIKPIPQGKLKADVGDLARPSPPEAKMESLDSLLERYRNASTGAVPEELSRKGDLLVFVSFSMPDNVLQEISRQAAEWGAVVVLRGLQDGSVDKTREAASAVNPTNVGWQVHPELFKAFKINSVPAIVLANAQSGSLDEEGCAPETSYASIAGNVPIEGALDLMRLRANPDVARLAKFRIDQYRSAARSVR